MLEQLVQQDETIEHKWQQCPQIPMGQATSIDQLLEQPVKQDVTMEQKQQQQQRPKIPMG